MQKNNNFCRVNYKIEDHLQNYPRFVLDTFDSKEQLIEGNFKERNVDHSTKVKHVGK